jgi:hypothetical protein
MMGAENARNVESDLVLKEDIIVAFVGYLYTYGGGVGFIWL